VDVSIISSWDSKFLYILGGTSTTDGQNVWVYKRDRTTGALTFVQANSITHGGIVPKDIKISPDGSILAVAFASEIYIYDINTTYGRLTYNSKHLKGTRSINAIVFGADGKYLYAGANGGKVYMYETTVFSGIIQTIDTGAPEALKVAMNYSGTALYAGEITGDTLYKFIVSPLSGQLTASTSTDVPRTNISSIIVNTSGMVPKNYFSQYINTMSITPNISLAVGGSKVYIINNETEDRYEVLLDNVLGAPMGIKVIPNSNYFVAWGFSKMALCKLSDDYTSASVVHTKVRRNTGETFYARGAVHPTGNYIYISMSRGILVYSVDIVNETLAHLQTRSDTDLVQSNFSNFEVTTDGESIIASGKLKVISYAINTETGLLSGKITLSPTHAANYSATNATAQGPDGKVAIYYHRTGVVEIYNRIDGVLNTVATLSAGATTTGSNHHIAWHHDSNTIFIGVEDQTDIRSIVYDGSTSGIYNSQAGILPLAGNDGHILSVDQQNNVLGAFRYGSSSLTIFNIDSDGSLSSGTQKLTIISSYGGVLFGENKISVNSTTTNSMSTAVTNVSPHAEIYLGTGVFDAANATELVPGVPLGVPDLTAIRYAAEIEFTGDELVNLLANVAIKVSKDDIDFINADPARIDSVIAHQTAGSKSFDMKELGNLGVKDATLSGDFDLGDGNDVVAVGGDVGELAIDMSATSNVLPVAAVLPKVIGSAMQLTGGKEEIYRIMVNESDFVNLAKFADDSQGARDSVGATVKLQDLLRAVDSAAGDELRVSEITTDASKPLSERRVGHEILLNLFRLAPPRPGAAGAANDPTFTGDVNGHWTYDDEDLLKLSKLPEDVNLQFVLKTSQDIVDAANAKIIGTQTTPSGTVSGLEDSADAGRVYVLFNFKFAKEA
jgi:6-phosphogluconolactonase (cycloisomerase 2 family)